MSRWTTPSKTVTHCSPEEQKSESQARLLELSLWLMVFLWVCGILAFLALHILQAFDPKRFISLDWNAFGAILFAPLGIAIFFCLASVTIASLVRDAKLDLLGRDVIGRPIPGTVGLRKQANDTVDTVFTVEFETPDGIHHRVKLVVPRGVSPYASSVRIRYDPLNLSNIVVNPEPRPSRHPIRVLYNYCGCLLGSLILAGFTLLLLVLFLTVFFVPISPPP